MNTNSMDTLHIPTRGMSGAVDMGLGISMEWLDDGEIVMFSMQEPSREAINRFADVFLNVVFRWDNTEPFPFIVNFSHHEFAFTPYMRTRFTELAAALSEVKMRSYTVAVLRRNLVGTMVMQFGNFIYRQAGNMDLKYVSTVEEGLDWLREKL